MISDGYGNKKGKCVTVKAEDRPSGSAGDSASVITFFPPSIGFGRVACACRGGTMRRRSRIKTVTYFYGQFLDSKNSYKLLIKITLIP